MSPPLLSRNKTLTGETILSTISSFPNNGPQSETLTLMLSWLPDTSFNGLLTHTKNVLLPSLLPRIAPALTEALDDDANQALMFSRRFESVCKLLHGVGPTQDVFYIALVCRVYEILDSPPDPNNKSKMALRVRAVSDFYYSHAAVLHHATAPTVPPQDFSTLINQSTPTDIAPGLQHSTVTGLSDQMCGPIRVNVLRVDTSLRSPTCNDARTEATSAYIHSSECAAAISGGFFLYSEAPINLPSKQTDPVGLLVTNGTQAPTTARPYYSAPPLHTPRVVS